MRRKTMKSSSLTRDQIQHRSPSTADIDYLSSPPPVSVICGPKNSGKTTFSRYLLNALLLRFNNPMPEDTRKAYHRELLEHMPPPPIIARPALLTLPKHSEAAYGKTNRRKRGKDRRSGSKRNRKVVAGNCEGNKVFLTG